MPVFEKTYNEYITNYGYDGDWYHVRTAQGEGWFNPKFAEPEDAVDETAAIQLNSPVTTLFRYPNTGIILNHGQIGPQTIHPLAAWTDPNGIRWYQINSFVGKSWIHLEPFQDRVILKDRESDIVITSATSYQGAFYQNEKGAYTEGNESIGYDDKQGEPFLDTAFLARMYHFDLTGPDVAGWWTLKNDTGYAFQIKTGELQVKTLWNGKLAKQLKLASSPDFSKDQGSPYLSLTDIRTLFGATTSVTRGYNNNKVVTLSAQMYKMKDDLQLPSIAVDTFFHMSGLIYENRYLEYNSITPALQITVKNRDLGETATTEHGAEMKFLYDLSYNNGLYDLSLDHPLQLGMNHLTISFHVGERIILQRDWDIMNTAK
ncbi:hypothetical protein [Paenibacillus qinlingensis]|uniref:hypothetical protein n=1 Tax=Paenibacillus qinlingensis TaxID=1837343 RepID=UPI001564E0F1|nr:hypothetical protein [Paenibacillus qinlingensis]NQX62840.1 hypothetical protein [Paenibacillus qinlingensis]